MDCVSIWKVQRPYLGEMEHNGTEVVQGNMSNFRNYSDSDYNEWDDEEDDDNDDQPELPQRVDTMTLVFNCLYLSARSLKGLL